MTPSSITSTIRIVLLYVLFGSLWIAVSDRIIELFISDPHRMTTIQTYKGWGFVLLSAIIIYFAASRELLARERAEEALKEGKERMTAISESSLDAIVLVDDEGTITYLNPSAERMFGYRQEEAMGRPLHSLIVAEESRHKYAQALEDFQKNGRCKVIGKPLEGQALRRDGSPFPVELSITAMQIKGKWHSAGTVRDITARRIIEEKSRKRLERLDTLHAIDQIITSSLDLHVTLGEVINHVMAQFQVDAADILLLNPHTLMLEYATGRGFRIHKIQESRLRLGEGTAGLAALEHRSIVIPDLRDDGNGFAWRALIEEEGFVSYHAVPLIAKGQVKGVLDLLHRTPLTLDAEQLAFLEAIAVQAAIAIDNATLFDELQRSNIELTLAYDATLEGWARALDLRNEATERHTMRVTEITMRLARAMHINEKDLVHIRRGALLHDIGKIGVPDSILLKPGPLTAEEQEVIRRHPVNAFNMLQPIAYLRPALDIPYCHHERWDGTGYPRGLKGEQIPLAARIFAVADIWDALYAMDRPYRKGLPKEEVREYIKSLAGTHLDPRVVEEFLKLEW
jgi:PAS domain S-box-containing protein/putative nucleotidyltransferase with HDIG domain